MADAEVGDPILQPGSTEGVSISVSSMRVRMALALLPQTLMTCKDLENC